MRHYELTESFTDDDVADREEKMLRSPLGPGWLTIYRAVPSHVTTFTKMDFVTGHKEFAKGHAESMAWTEEEPYHVIKKLIDNTKEPLVYKAPNEGELFYYGPDVKGKIIYVAQEWAEFNQEI